MVYRVIALCGKAGSGKDTLMHEVRKILPELHEMVSCTTRPPREGEVDGVNYYFLTDEEFMSRIADGSMIESTIFNNWYYGTCLNTFHSDDVNIGVYNPEGIHILQNIPNVIVYPIFIAASDKTRLLRQLNRENEPDVQEIIRRFSADEIDFNESNLQNIVFQYEVDNDGHFGIWQLGQELAAHIQQIDW